jgi:hypothetical protein
MRSSRPSRRACRTQHPTGWTGPSHPSGVRRSRRLPAAGEVTHWSQACQHARAALVVRSSSTGCCAAYGRFRCCGTGGFAYGRNGARRQALITQRHQLRDNPARSGGCASCHITVSVPFTPAWLGRKGFRVKLWCGGPLAALTKEKAVPIRQSSTNFDVVAPIKARTCDALYAVVRSKPRKPGADPRLMRKGAERC